MYPDEKQELMVARFTFVSHVHPQYPMITMTRKKHTPSGSMSVVRDWFDRVLNAEKQRIPRDTIIEFAEYRILSGDTNLFKAEGFRFDKILLVLSDEITHWIFYQNMPFIRRVEGQAKLPISFCSCCFQNHYKVVMKSIKDSLRKPIFV